VSESADRIVSHYRIVTPLGVGGMGEVYAAVDETLQRRVALKSIRADHRWSTESKARFLREARLLSQLDHPNVCRVYDFVEDAGQQWLVLELIEGTDLRALIVRGLDASARMRIAEQLATVLVATHAAGVVHRDLKPANVMVTPAGDVKVLDFGLAHSVAAAAPVHEQAGAPLDLDAGWDPRSAETMAPPASLLADHADHRSVFRTEGGTLSGTLAYMSPEQAVGDPATTASDMYSCGLVLQELFTGARAYHQGLSAPELLERVRRADSPPATGTSSDIGALIRRMKSLAPSQRPTAIEALERLQWIRHKPARRIRRAAAAAIVVAGLLGAAKYTYDLARERAVAVAARADADRRRDQAEGLIGFMLGDLQTKLQRLGRLDLLEDVGRVATSYFKTVPPEALSDEELYRRSQSLYQIGQVYQAKGSLPNAIVAYRDSLALMTQVAGRVPDNTDWQLGLGTAYFYLGDALRRQGDLDGALAHFRSYWQVAERLSARDPNNQTWRLEVSYGHSNVAAVLEAQGELNESLAELRTTLTVKQQVSDSDPANPEWRRAVANTHNRIGVVLLKLGRLEEATSHLRQDVDIGESLLAATPNDAPLRATVAVSHSWLATAFEYAGADFESAVHRQAGLRLTSELVAKDPANNDWQRERAVAQMRMADLEYGGGRTVSAEARYRESLAALTTLLARNPTRLTLRRDVASGHHRIARILLAANKPAAAVDASEACRAVLVPVESSALPDPDTRAGLVQCDLLAGAALTGLGRAQQATDVWQRALATIEPLTRNSNDPARLQLLARALARAGRVQEAEAVVQRLEEMGYRNTLFRNDLRQVMPGK
jgi:serine/threonine-protein kinase